MNLPRSVNLVLKALFSEGKRQLENESFCSHADFILAISESVFTPDDIHIPDPKRQSEKTIFYKKIAFDVEEVITSYEVLYDFPLMARSKPPKSTRLTPTKVIIFWRESYLNELYIFNCRLLTLIKRAGRAYRHEDEGTKIQDLCNSLEALVQEAMEPLVKMRGTHVHESRYFTSDPELERIRLLENLASGTGKREFKQMYLKAIRDGKKQSTANFRAFNLHAKDRLTSTFNAFLYFMLDPDGQLRYPTNLKS